MGKDAPPDEEGDLGEAAGVSMNQNIGVKKVKFDCCGFVGFTWLAGITTAIWIWWIFGDQVVSVFGIALMGSWLAIPSGIVMMILLIMLAPWMFVDEDVT
jgi:hypothetical protein